MATETYRDNLGRTIGTITTDSLGNKTVRDKMGRTVGTYKASTKTTHDELGRIIAHGDLSASLLTTRF